MNMKRQNDKSAPDTATRGGCAPGLPCRMLPRACRAGPAARGAPLSPHRAAGARPGRGSHRGCEEPGACGRRGAASGDAEGRSASPASPGCPRSSVFLSSGRPQPRRDLVSGTTRSKRNRSSKPPGSAVPLRAVRCHRLPPTWARSAQPGRSQSRCLRC